MTPQNLCQSNPNNAWYRARSKDKRDQFAIRRKHLLPEGMHVVSLTVAFLTDARNSVVRGIAVATRDVQTILRVVNIDPKNLLKWPIVSSRIFAMWLKMEVISCSMRNCSWSPAIAGTPKKVTLILGTPEYFKRLQGLGFKG